MGQMADHDGQGIMVRDLHAKLQGFTEQHVAAQGLVVGGVVVGGIAVVKGQAEEEIQKQRLEGLELPEGPKMPVQPSVQGVCSPGGAHRPAQGRARRQDEFKKIRRGKLDFRVDSLTVFEAGADEVDVLHKDAQSEGRQQ